MHFPSPKKKIPNKCHTNYPVVVKPLNKQAITFWCGKFQSHKKSVQFSLPAHPSSVSFFIFFFCFVHEEERGGRCSFKSKHFYFYFSACCLCQLSVRRIKKNPWTCCKCKAHNNALLSSKLLVTECYPADPKYEGTIIIPPSVFNYGGGGTSSHIKVYRRPLALGGFVESSCILTHILTRGQVTYLIITTIATGLACGL